MLSLLSLQDFAPGIAEAEAGAVAVAPEALEAPVVVLGFGNVLLSDDGAGVRAVERLRRELEVEAQEEGRAAVRCIDAGTLSFSLLPFIEGAESMLVIDAANLGAPAGTVKSYEGEAMDRFLQSHRRRTVHELGLIDLLDMARLRGALPPRRALLCIQPQRLDWGGELSAPVERSMGEAVLRASLLLRRWWR